MSKVKKASRYEMFVCECGCGSVNLLLFDDKDRPIAAAQMHPTTILTDWQKIAHEALLSKPNPKPWDRSMN